MLVGFLHLKLESIKVAHKLFDLLNWQLNQHTCDLGRLLGADKHDNEVVDALSNL